LTYLGLAIKRLNLIFSFILLFLQLQITITITNYKRQNAAFSPLRKVQIKKNDLLQARDSAPGLPNAIPISMPKRWSATGLNFW
jgi:hypothetical protein